MSSHRISLQRVESLGAINEYLLLWFAMLLEHNTDGLSGSRRPGRGDQDGAARAKDTHHILAVHLHARKELSNDIARETECRGSILIYAADLADMTGSNHAYRIREILARSRTCDQPGHRGAIAADIQNAAAAQFVVEQTTFGVKGGLEAKRGLDQAHITNRSSA